MELKFYYFIVGFVFLLIGLLFGRLISEVKFSKKLKKNREDAVKRSKSVVNGQLLEQIAPILPNFPCNPQDVRFIGKPIDFISFDGISENNISEITFIEIKTGNSKLSEREKQIKKVVDEKRIKYIEYRMS